MGESRDLVEDFAVRPHHTVDLLDGADNCRAMASPEHHPDLVDRQGRQLTTQVHADLSGPRQRLTERRSSDLGDVEAEGVRRELDDDRRGEDVSGGGVVHVVAPSDTAVHRLVVKGTIGAVVVDAGMVVDDVHVDGVGGVVVSFVVVVDNGGSEVVVVFSHVVAFHRRVLGWRVGEQQPSYGDARHP